VFLPYQKNANYKKLMGNERNSGFGVLIEFNKNITEGNPRPKVTLCPQN
jgi:hypothetical protein